MAMQLEKENQGTNTSAMSNVTSPNENVKQSDKTECGTVITASLEQLKKVKHKTIEQKRLYDKLRKQAQRSQMTQTAINQQNAKDKTRKSKHRAQQSKQEQEIQKEKDRER